MNTQTTNKPWGKEELLECNDFYAVKRITMMPGECCSLQYHESKTETIYVVSGILTVDIEGFGLTLKAGEGTTINPGVLHRMYAKSTRNAIYLECSTPELSDVVRVIDNYGRETKEDVCTKF